MVQTCSYINCDGAEKPNCGLSFFSFPLENPETLKAWILVAKSGFVPTECSKLCSKHFLNSDYQETSGGNVGKLKENAVPLMPTSSQPPVKICKIENQITPGTSSIKEHPEDELSEVVNPTLATSIKTEAVYASPPEAIPLVDTSTPTPLLGLESELNALKIQASQQALRIRNAKRLLKKEEAKGRRLNAKIDVFMATYLVQFISSHYSKKS